MSVSIEFRSFSNDSVDNPKLPLNVNFFSMKSGKNGGLLGAKRCPQTPTKTGTFYA